MFLQKISQLASDWGRSDGDLGSVARESLLYGMRFIRYPSALKRELRKVKIDSLLAKPLWSGDAYLLLELPEVLTNPKKKIPCLADYHFAKKTLTSEQIKQLRSQVEKRCKIPREELLQAMLPEIKRVTWRGRFLTRYDGMYENLEDVQSDLTVISLEILNKEICNFNSANKDDISKYLSYCMKKKGDTFLSKKTPNLIKANIEAEDFDRVVHSALEDDVEKESPIEMEFREDLKKLVTPKVYRGVSLLLGFEDVADRSGFNYYLTTNKLNIRNLNQNQLKKHIEKYLGSPVFEKAMENEKLREFLLNKIRSEQMGGEDDSNSRSA